MQQLVAMLTHYNSYQIWVTVITIILTLVLLIISIFSKRMVSFVTFVRAMAIGMIFGCFVIYLDFSHQMNEAVAKHEYKAIKNQKTLEIKSNSDMIKDYKFEIDSEDKEHIYIHRGTFLVKKAMLLINLI